MRRTIRALLLTLCAATPLAAQAPDEKHVTLRTPHFAVHFPPALEPVARRAAASAERAYARLAQELTPPRGTIELVVSDNVDFANGYATVVPTNRIVVYAHPPLEARTLRQSDDHIDLVVTHEVVHIFHLDRARGMWRVLQNVFGRAAPFFPNAYSPSWVTEGLATYYESRITGSGRVVGTEHAALVRAASLGGRFPRLDQVNGISPLFPGGNQVYVYGSLFFDYLARTRGPESVRALIERQAVHPLPFVLNRVSRVAFGISYDEGFQQFRDSIRAAAGQPRDPVPGWRDLSPPSFAAEYLRWLDSDRLSYAGGAPREIAGMYVVTPSGEREFLGRRNDATPAARLPDGALLYSQPDFVDPYRLRRDLYVDRNGRTERLTRGARLSSPTARADGQVVVVQAFPNGSRLVRFDVASRAVTPFAGDADEQWTEPVWSPDGRHVAAVRWQRGGASSVLILDTLGAVVRELGRARAVVGSPAWLPDSRRVIFGSDTEGRAELYLASIDGSELPRRISATATAFTDPSVSPDGRWLGAVRLDAEGYRVGVAPLDEVLAAATPAPAPTPVPPYAAAGEAAGPVRPYNALRQLVPRFWFPVIEEALDGTRYGAFTAGNDVLERHAYEVQYGHVAGGRDHAGYLLYTYGGFTQPFVTLAASQDWLSRRYLTRDADTVVAPRRVRDLAAALQFVRPRIRSTLAATVSGALEQRRNVVFRTTGPFTPSPGFTRDSLVPRAALSLSYVRVQSAPLAISPEDGLALSGSLAGRWSDGRREPVPTAVGASSFYRSFLGGGFARHVVALRATGGATTTRTSSPLEVGGSSGGALPLLFGLATVGEGRRSFFVRGFPSETLFGTRAAAASAEYRAPLRVFARGLGLLPAFVDRSSIAVFGDAASAWCPTYRRAVCSDSAGVRPVLASVGAEGRVTASFGLWEVPFLFRLGVAVPVSERDRARDAASVYLSTGASF